MRNPSVQEWWVIGPTHARIEDSIIPVTVWALDMLGLKAGIDYRIIRSKPQRIELLRTKQNIRFISGDRPETIVSATIGGYWISEPGIMKEQVYHEIEKRTRAKAVNRQLSLIEGTPEGDNWYKDQFDINQTDPERKLRRFILEIWDNEHNLEPSYIPRLIKLFEHDKAKTESYIYGRFSAFDNGDVFAQYIESRNLIPQVEPDPNKTVHLCFDFNATPLTWSAWQLMPYKKGINTKMREICLAESSLNCTSLYQAALEIGLAFPHQIFNHTKFEIWGDRTGHAKSHKAPGTDFTNLKNILDEAYSNIHISAIRQVTPIRASVDIVNRMFLYELMLICENCKNIRRSFSNTRWAIGKSDLEKKAGETHTHHGDGMRYRIYPLYKDSNLDDLSERSKITGTNFA